MNPSEALPVEVPPSTVRCGACTACCKSSFVALTEDDDPSQYDTHEVEGVTMLKQKPNGHCVYLKDRCTIYERRPYMCRVFDCVRMWKKTPAKMRRQVMSKAVRKAAQRRRLTPMRR